MKISKSLAPLALIAAFPLLTKAKSPLNYSLAATSFAHSVDSTQVESRVVGLYLELDSHYTLSPTITFKLNSGAILETGTDRSLWVSEFSPDQQVVLNEASFNWIPLKYFELSVGALDQSYYDLPTLVDGSAFAGAREIIKLSLGEGRELSLSSQQSLPSNQTLSNRLGDVESGTPKFFLHQISLKLDGDLLALKLYGGLFEFSDLSEGVAQQSRFLGNSVVGISASNATFSYDFKGQFFGGEISWFVSEELGFHIKGHMLENSEAPDLRSKARYVEGSFNYQKLQIGLSHFRIESDASVAFYNSKKFGHNNREGFAPFLNYKADFAEFSLLYSQSDTISAGPYQGNQRYIYAGLSKTLF